MNTFAPFMFRPYITCRLATSYLLLIAYYVLPTNALNAQGKEKELHISKVQSVVKIDGKLDEACWLVAEKAKDFWQVFPFDSSKGKTKTEVMMAYDNKFLYIAANCYDDLPGDYVIQSLKRDYSYPISDAFNLTLDPFNDHTNGFAFGVNALGAQREGLVTFGGWQGVTTDWDNIWFSEVRQEKGRWVVEMAIPFKSIRFNEGTKEWGVNFARNDLKRNESSSWNPVPRIFNIATLNFCGHLIFDEAPKKPSFNAAFIPYVTAGLNEDYQKKTGLKTMENAGVDGKIVVTPSLNLDLTINPDFSQVEVDRQQVNLTRFNLFYPEKRLFFNDNSDLFAQYGFRQIRPFFSRQIGLYQSPIDLSLKNIPIIAGARLSGKIGKDTRIGIMDVQTGADTALQINSQNYFVTAVQQQVSFKKGKPKTHNLAFIAVNRQRASTDNPNDPAFNRVLGADLNLNSPDSKLKGKIFMHQSFSPGIATDWNSNANATFINYTSNTYYWSWNHEYVGKNYRAEVGYVPRIDLYDFKALRPLKMTYGRLEPDIGYRIFPRKGWLKKRINNIKLDLYNDSYFDSTLIRLTDLKLQTTMSVAFQSSATFSLSAGHQYSKLLFDTKIGNVILPGGKYNWRYIHYFWETNKRKKLTLSHGLAYDGFYGGSLLNASLDVAYRYQPYGIFSISLSRNALNFPQLGQQSTIWLIGPKAEMAFTRNLFFTTFIQYNTQIKNMNINTRLQWRYRPMSDLFIVYSDNYDPNLNVKNRALVLKWIYWLQRM